MSYILDALKKSEQQREHGTIPNVQTMHSSSLNYHDEKKTYWPYILIVAVTLNFIAIVYFIIDKEAAVESPPTPVQHTVSISTNNTEIIEPIAIDSNQFKALEKSTINVTKPVETKNPAPDKSTSVEKKTYITAEKSNNVTATQDGGRTKTNMPSVQLQKEVIDFYDLPASTKQQLPTIVVTAHIYSSNPLQRSIVINNKFMEEGGYVIDNMILYEITADGAIFDYGETRFHFNVVSGWQ